MATLGNPEKKFSVAEEMTPRTVLFPPELAKIALTALAQWLKENAAAVKGGVDAQHHKSNLHNEYLERLPEISPKLADLDRSIKSSQEVVEAEQKKSGRTPKMTTVTNLTLRELYLVSKADFQKVWLDVDHNGGKDPGNVLEKLSTLQTPEGTFPYQIVKGTLHIWVTPEQLKSMVESQM